MLIPGVIEFSLCYAGVKLATFGMLFWLPKFSHDKLEFNDNQKTLVIILFDVGTIVGNILLGFISDLLYGKRGLVCFSIILAPIGCMMIIFLDKEQKIEIFIVIFLLGLIIGGIANTISTTVSTDLSKNDLLKDNSKA